MDGGNQNYRYVIISTETDLLWEAPAGHLNEWQGDALLQARPASEQTAGLQDAEAVSARDGSSRIPIGNREPSLISLMDSLLNIPEFPQLRDIIQIAWATCF